MDRECVRSTGGVRGRRWRCRSGFPQTSGVRSDWCRSDCRGSGDGGGFAGGRLCGICCGDSACRGSGAGDAQTIFGDAFLIGIPDGHE
ncbi:MAG: hypothetical protein ACK559_32390, partial [bacterium]